MSQYNIATMSNKQNINEDENDFENLYLKTGYME